jgi:hypothetical protein
LGNPRRYCKGFGFSGKIPRRFGELQADIAVCVYGQVHGNAVYGKGKGAGSGGGIFNGVPVLNNRFRYGFGVRLRAGGKAEGYGKKRGKVLFYGHIENSFSGISCQEFIIAWGVGNGKRRMENGEWGKIGSGEWRMGEDREWRMENGGERV